MPTKYKKYVGVQILTMNFLKASKLYVHSNLKKNQSVRIGFFFNYHLFAKGFEQAVKKQSSGLFFRRGNERSEAIGAGAPRQNPFERARKKDLFRQVFFSSI